MTPTEFAAVATAVAWPAVAILVLGVYSEQLRSLFEKLISSLSVKSIKLKALGSEMELSVEQAKSTLNEQLQAIADASNELTVEELALFDRVLAAEGRLTVEELIPGFQRHSSSHNQLRRLRDRMLIAPLETGNWRQDKHPVVTRFGKLVHQLKAIRASAA